MLFYFVQITYNFNYKTTKFTILVVILFYLHFGPPPPDLFTMQRNSRVSPPIPFFPSLPNGKMDKNSPPKKKKKK